MQGLRLFTIATCLPVVLILLAAMLGGAWAWIALGYLTVLTFLLDRLVAAEAAFTDPDAEFPAADTLLTVLGLSHFALYAAALWAIAGPSGLGGIERFLTGFATGLFFGQVSHPVAHELIHRPSRARRLLGRLIYTSLLVGHHASAHLRVHHVHVGSDEDPNSARRGEGFYRYALRASAGSFRAGLAAENRLRAGRKPLWTHPYALYLGGAAAMVGGALVLGGAKALFAVVALSLYAQMQILLSDYVQHYGLRRATLPDGRTEPVGPHHSWNTPHWFSSALMLNAPRHSDHHVTPSRSYPALQLDRDTMPMLPLPLPLMATIALFPTLWRRMMDRRCARWRERADERALRAMAGE
ncbi:MULTISPECIES: alkane 1-monooxygenase [unclassified Roseovarius]|uniref:alkane 1-monooxygenase n=1 Tax=unclassified Roseovarius TaxID=2614913 RepID=UPI00273E74F7|nr:alkane 1-monooxygenase [Roseovarius sp. MMSF_3350]